MSLEANQFGPPHRLVEAAAWHDEVAALKADGYTFFDWLSAVDEHPEGFRLVLHVARLTPALDHLLLATYLDRGAPTAPSIADVYAGAAWHERETHEMFGLTFVRAGEPVDDEPLLLPDGFEGYPLRKEFVLASRVAKAWPGAKEPGESDADSARAPGRRRVKPPGVPDDWLQPTTPGPDREAGDE
ncbi:NADH-quinone oxidoreductase subunit C [Aeromicrobium endophyticum]|uniref:NADH-quinone oxidoreductase subunit C n=1 Tax=Aeromicrobium endophyticum TaxID=2292704 RepID=A0A371P9A4_9ACTN|nr:NADH-quinone oxidoreductase subunit C [Aeromicrobium endophyticum]REK72482.1 NADH-quinone oxidoreductase subunit C [Aeromicrobium endophyticum]